MPELPEVEALAQFLRERAVGRAVARVEDGRCEPIHEVAATTVRPTASQFKLFVLGALAEQVDTGELKWHQPLTITDSTRSLGNGAGSLQTMPTGSTVTVEQAAGKMIAISDNTAADMLLGLVGRDAVEAQTEQWAADASADEPFLTTRQMFLLHYVPGLADRYLATSADQRAAFLASEVDPRPITDIAAGVSTDPRYVESVEWFATPADVCQAFAGLHELSARPSLAPLSTILSGEVRGLELDPEEWPTVWYKGGSEPGVLTLGWLANNAAGATYVVQAMITDPDAALADDAIPHVVELAKQAFALAAPGK